MVFKSYPIKTILLASSTDHFVRLSNNTSPSPEQTRFNFNNTADKLHATLIKRKKINIHHLQPVAPLKYMKIEIIDSRSQRLSPSPQRASKQGTPNTINP
mgnify:CR=1 FL=1